MNVLIWILIAFLSGAVPYSVLVGKLAGHDIRAYGDHNPGAMNVLRATGTAWFVLAMLLDALKGALPVAAAITLGGIAGWEKLPVALAPIAGHAFSPFLGGRGGKALAVTFGVWTGLTLATGPLALGLLFVLAIKTIRPDGWAVGAAMLVFGAFLALVYLPGQPELLAVWLGNFLLLAYKHRDELSQRPQWRSSHARQ